MQTIKQIVCPRCQELNPAHYTACEHCGMELAPPPIVRPAPPVEAAPPRDLPPLVWAIACFFLALWGITATGLLPGLLAVLTHPYVLVAMVVISILLTGVFIAERLSHEPPPDRLLSSRDVMALSWTVAALLGATQLIKFIVPPVPTITHYEMLPQEEGKGCRVEAFIRASPGDELWRLTGVSRKNEKEIVGIIVRRPAGGSARLPLTMHTQKGECAIAKYRLIIDGREADHVDGVGQ